MHDPIKIRVQAGQHDRHACPVNVVVPKSYDAAQALELVETKSKTVFPVQRETVDGGIRIHWILDELAAGTSAKFVLRVAKSKKRESKSQVQLSDDAADGRVDIHVGKKLFTSYHYGSKWVRPFLHPVIGPGGVRVTRNWPVTKAIKGEDKDHAHHKSIWVAYGECNGVDNWSEESGHGYQRHRKFDHLESGPVFGRIVSEIDWCDKDEKKQFGETRELRVYALPNGDRMLDLQVTFRMTELPVVFTDTKEGGLLSIRVAGTMEGQHGGRIENSFGGVGESETWGKPASWCDYSGLAEGKHVGIAAFDHQDNPRYPTNWHVRDYGLMTANSFGLSYFRPDLGRRGDMTFEQDSVTNWRYRVFIHRGNAKKGRVRERYLDYVAPPQVAVES